MYKISQLFKLVRLIILLVYISSDIVNSSHDGYKVFKIYPKTEEQKQFVSTLAEDDNLDFWTNINKIGDPVVVMINPKGLPMFKQQLSSYKIPYDVQIENLEDTLREERVGDIQRSNYTGGRISFTQYHRHSEINSYLRQISEQYPARVRLSLLGRSYQNRDLYSVRISSDFQNRNRPVIFVEAGMHAREWISPAFALYLINQLVENPANEELVRLVDWIVIPVMNPDGYEYTWTTNRMWRKTRSPNSGTCIGTDGNRNFDFHWMVAGASSNPCSDTYAGNRAFSEPEARLLRDLLAATKNIKAFISVHSYGQYFFYPYSYADIKPTNWPTLHSLALNVTKAISGVNGTSYRVGSSTELLYPAAGCTDDWAMGGANISVVYCIELPGGGSQGFNLPPARILPVVQETFEGFKIIQQYVVNNIP